MTLKIKINVINYYNNETTANNIG